MADSSNASGSGKNYAHLNQIILAEDGRNFLAWEATITLLLKNEPKAWECSQGKNEQTDPEYAKINLIAKSIILDSLSPSLIATKFSKLTADLTASDAWTTIKNRFAQTTATAKDTALAEFFAFRFESNRTVIQNVDRLQQVMNEVTMSAASLDDSVCCHRLLQILPKSWESLRLFWSVKSADDQTLPNLYTLIQGWAARRDQSARKNDLSANFSQLSIRNRGHPIRYLYHDRSPRQQFVPVFNRDPQRRRRSNFNRNQQNYRTNNTFNYRANAPTQNTNNYQPRSNPQDDRHPRQSNAANQRGRGLCLLRDPHVTSSSACCRSNRHFRQ